MLSLIFLLSISFFVSEASARNPKYEKMRWLSYPVDMLTRWISM